MKLKATILSLVIALFLVITPSSLYAQDDDVGHVFTVSTYQWPFDNLDAIFKNMEEDMDLVKKNEFIISSKVMTHGWAGDFSVMIVNEFKSMDDVSKWQKRAGELYRAKYPDEAMRDKRDAAGSKLFGDGIHIDSIVYDNPKLSK